MVWQLLYFLIQTAQEEDAASVSGKFAVLKVRSTCKQDYVTNYRFTLTVYCLYSYSPNTVSFPAADN